MADEITAVSQITLSNGSNHEQWVSSDNIDQAAEGSIKKTLGIGTSEEVIDLDDISTPGWCMLQNLDATNFVEWGPTSGGSMVVAGRLIPGEPPSGPFRLDPSISLRMQADTAACLVKLMILED